jgi:hypothetical protein
MSLYPSLEDMTVGKMAKVRVVEILLYKLGNCGVKFA